MFTIEQIKEKHAKVKSGADFPQYVQDLIELGVVRYDVHVVDGHTNYFGKYDYKIESGPKYEPLQIADKSDALQFQHYLLIHQHGETDYLTFCKHAAESGVEQWVMDLDDMMCIYYDKVENIMKLELIPTV